MPQERISTKIWQRPAALDRVAFRGEKEIWAQGIELHGDFKPCSSFGKGCPLWVVIPKKVQLRQRERG